MAETSYSDQSVKIALRNIFHPFAGAEQTPCIHPINVFKLIALYEYAFCPGLRQRLSSFVDQQCLVYWSAFNRHIRVLTNKANATSVAFLPPKKLFKKRL